MISFENMNSFQFWKPNIYATPSCWWQFCISLAGYGVSLPLMWKQHLSQILWLANCKIKLPTVFLSRQLFWLALEQATYILNIDVLNVEKRQNTNLCSPKAGVTRQKVGACPTASDHCASDWLFANLRRKFAQVLHYYLMMWSCLVEGQTFSFKVKSCHFWNTLIQPSSYKLRCCIYTPLLPLWGLADAVLRLILANVCKRINWNCLINNIT